MRGTMVSIKFIALSMCVGLTTGRRIRLDLKSALSPAEASVEEEAAPPQRQVPPADRALFGSCGGKCDQGERCVLVADSYGTLRPAHLGKREMSPQEAAIALLQDQYVLNKHINGTAVTPSNVAALAGVEAFVQVDGREVPFDVVDKLLGSNHELSVRWRRAPGFQGVPTHTQAMVDLSSGMWGKDHGQWITWSNVTSGFKSATAATTQVFKFVTNADVMKNFVESLKGVVGSLDEFFACLADLPEQYRMGGVGELLKLVAQSPSNAIKEVYNVWIRPPLSTLKDFVTKEEEAETHLATNVKIGESATNEKCVNVPLVGSLMCDPNAGNAGMRLKGGSSPETFEIVVKNHTTVCARRTDAAEGWPTMDLWVKCAETMQGFPVIMGRSTDQKKCVHVAASGMRCSHYAANPGYRLDLDQETGITFEVTVDEKEKQICAERTDAAQGWELNLKFECHANSYNVDFGTLLEGSWKVQMIERAWVMLNDMMAMPNMEVGHCITEHVLFPLKAATYDVAMVILTYADAQVREFFGSISLFLQRTLTGLQVEGFAGVKFADLHVVAKAAANAACTKELEQAVTYRQTPGVNLTATYLKPVTMIAPAVARSVVKTMMGKLANYVTFELLSPMIRTALAAMQDAAADLLLLLNGVCGVIPEVGGIICDAFEMPLNGAIVYMQEPMYNEAIAFVLGLFDKLTEKIAVWITAEVQKIAELGVKLVLDMKQKAYEVIEEAISGVTWVTRIVQKSTIHSALDLAFAGILDFISGLLVGMSPNIEGQVDECGKLRNIIVGLA